jgi:putative heme transporter
VIWLLYQVRVVVIPLMLGAFLASLGTPLVGRLAEKGVPRMLGTWVAVVIWIVIFVLVGWFIIASVQSSANEMGMALEDSWQRLLEWLETIPIVLDGQTLPQTLERLFANAGFGAGGIGQGVASGLGSATEAVTWLFLSIIVAFFLVKDGERFWNWILSKTSAQRRDDIDRAGAGAWATLRRYLTGTALVGVVNATALAITLLILDVPLVAPLAILMFLGAFFPLVGAIVSGTIIALVVLATNGLTDALIVAGVVIVVQQLEGDLVAPLILGKAVALHPLLILFGITAGFVIGGIVGAFVTVPFLAIVTEVTRTLRPDLLQTESEPDEPGRDHDKG